jgi:hypothetical protein
MDYTRVVVGQIKKLNSIESELFVRFLLSSRSDNPGRKPSFTEISTHAMLLKHSFGSNKYAAKRDTSVTKSKFKGKLLVLMYLWLSRAGDRTRSLIPGKNC